MRKVKLIQYKKW